MTKKINIIKKIFKLFGILIGCIILLGILLVLLLTITEYNPKESESVLIQGNATKTISTGDNFSILSWNLGYGALGENQDFFYDGGKNVYGDSKNVIYENLEAIKNTLINSECNIILLQEVDLNSSRSHYINENKFIIEALNNFQNSHATNYKVLFIPFPFPPMGKVNCGITTLSAYNVDSAARIALPTPFSYPIRICNLKRALLINRIPIDNCEKELVIINLHLEAYDSGEDKIVQTNLLKKLPNEEIAKGNYVIAGGDFNQTFSNIDISKFGLLNDEIWKPQLINIEDFSKDFSFFADENIPSCRSLDKPYASSDKSPDKFQYYIIDGFICSSNIEVNRIETLDLNFKNSDHNPVKINVTLKK